MKDLLHVSECYERNSEKRHFDLDTEDLFQVVLKNSSSWEYEKIEKAFKKRDPARLSKALRRKYEMLVDAVSAMEQRVNSTIVELTKYRKETVGDVLEQSNYVLQNYEFELPQNKINQIGTEANRSFKATFVFRYPKKIKSWQN